MDNTPPKSVTTSTDMKFNINLSLTEREARVLYALFCYGPDHVLKSALVCGSAIKEVPQYEQHFAKLSDKAYQGIGVELDKINRTRRVFNTI